MEYKSIAGPVYSRHALSPPIINSEMGTKIGIKARCMVEPGQYAGIEVGGNVKCRGRLKSAEGAGRKVQHSLHD